VCTERSRRRERSTESTQSHQVDGTIYKHTPHPPPAWISGSPSATTSTGSRRRRSGSTSASSGSASRRSCRAISTRNVSTTRSPPARSARPPPVQPAAGQLRPRGQRRHRRLPAPTLGAAGEFGARKSRPPRDLRRPRRHRVPRGRRRAAPAGRRRRPRDAGVEVVVENVGHQHAGLQLSVLGDIARETDTRIFRPRPRVYGRRQQGDQTVPPEPRGPDLTPPLSRRPPPG